MRRLKIIYLDYNKAVRTGALKERLSITQKRTLYYNVNGSIIELDNIPDLVWDSNDWKDAHKFCQMSRGISKALSLVEFKWHHLK